MSNMSYCRFQNTVLDLNDCADVLEEILTGQHDAKLSDDERCAAIRLVSLCTKVTRLVAESITVELDDLDLEYGSQERNFVALLEVAPVENSENE